SLPNWPGRPHLVEGHDDRWRAFRLAGAALAASGTVTLELAVAGTPMVVAYKVEPWSAPFLRRMIKAKAIALPNLILAENVFPELIQEDCTSQTLAVQVDETLRDTPARQRQLSALARIPDLIAVAHGSPSEAAARIVLENAAMTRA